MVTRKPKGLGKGLDNFFGVKSVADVLDTSPDETLPSTLPINSLHPGKFQPRTKFEQDSLKDLSDSIKANGILNPIVVRRTDADKFEILAGERRYQAALLAGLKKVPVRILGVNDKQAMIIGLVENLQREDLNVMEVAAGLERLVQEFKYSHEEIAAAIGRSRPMISNILRLLSLPQEIQDMVREGQLDMGHARCLLSLPEKERISAANLIISKDLSVRQTEELVRRMKEQSEQKDQPKALFEKNKEWASYEKELSKILNLKVKVTSGDSGKGVLRISFNSKKDMEELMRLLSR